MTQQSRDLSGFTGAGYNVGRGKAWQAAWLTVSGTIFMRWWMPARLRAGILRFFGASIGDGVLIRHRVRVHWPWKLTVGANSWVGEGVWILNLEPITIGNNVCVSQDVLLCAGSHSRTSPTFEFENAPIFIADDVWLAARSTVLAGVSIGRGSVVGATTLITQDVAPNSLIVAPRGYSR